MGIDEKITNAKKTDWLTKGLSEEEIKNLVEIAQEYVKYEHRLKADYENRLKADMVAMLTELQLEIEEMVNPFGTRISGCSQDGWKHGVKNCDFVIQEKINSLKEA